MKEQLKEQRLISYEGKMFELEMDLVALEAIDDKENADKVRQLLEGLKKSYKAVESMKV